MSEKNLTTAQVKKIKKSLPPSLLAIAKDIDHAGGKLFLVGGFVRDFFLKRGKQGLAKDFDLEVFNLDEVHGSVQSRGPGGRPRPKPGTL